MLVTTHKHSMLKFTRDPLSLTLALSLSPSHPHTLSLSLAVTSESKGYKQFEDELSPPTRQSWSSESKDGSGYLPPTSSPTSDCDDRKMAAIDVVLDSGSVDLEQEAADLELALKMQVRPLDVQEGILDGSVKIYKVELRENYNATGTIGDQRYA